MNFYLITTLILSIVTLILSQPDIDLDDEESEWAEFKRVYEKSYTDDERRRKEIWSQNRQHIAKMNEKRRLFTGYEEIDNLPENGFTLKMNKYGDLTHDEFRVHLNGFKATKIFEKYEDMNSERELRDMNEFKETAVPISVDWRSSGYVTSVRDQGLCGCCYVFAGVAALEGQYAKKYGKLLSLSDQNFLNCAKSGYFVDRNGVVEPLTPGIIQAFGYSANGCNGGSADAILQYSKFNGFLLLANVPYTGKPATCSQSPTYSYLTAATVSGFKHVYPHGNETALVNAIASIGPIAVGIQGDLQSFQYYSSGIYNDPSCTSANINHAVTVVGYGSLGPGQDYYIIKNSWGTSWGMKGYGYIARNKGNRCGIASYASYPIL